MIRSKCFVQSFQRLHRHTEKKEHVEIYRIYFLGVLVVYDASKVVTLL